MRTDLAVLSMLVLGVAALPSRQVDVLPQTGPYLGQTPPGRTPEVFAPGVVSTKEHREFSGTFTPDGREYYFFRYADRPVMLVARWTPQGWTTPQPAAFNSGYIDNEPHITFDGRYLFFCSNRPFPGGPSEGRRPTQVWFMERTGETWGQPKHLQMGMFATTARNGNVYINDVVYGLVNDALVRREESAYDASVPEAERLRPDHTFIAQDESYRLIDVREIPYVSFRLTNGTWSRPIDLRGVLDVSGPAGLATVSQDGKYVFFQYKADIYWVSAGILDALSPKAGR